MGDQPVTRPVNPADGFRGIAAAMLLWTMGAHFFANLPVYLERAGAMFGFSIGQLGFMSSAYLFGYMLGSAGGVLWLPKANWKPAMIAATAVAGAMLWLAQGVGSFAVLIPALAVLGIAKGSIAATCFRLLGAATDTNRNFGIAGGIQTVVNTLLVLVLTAVVLPNFGFEVYTLGMAIMLAILLAPLLVWLPANADALRYTTEEGSTIRKTKLLPVLLSQNGMLLLFAGFVGVWAFAASIGVSAGYRPEAVGTVVAFGTLSVGAGSILSGIQSTRWGHRVPLTVSAAAVVIVIFLVDRAAAQSFAAYAAALLAFMFFIGYLMTFVFGIIAVADPEGKYTAASGTSQGIGATIGPALVGLTVSAGQYTGLVIVCGAAIVLTAVTGLLALAAVNRTESESHARAGESGT